MEDGSRDQLLVVVNSGRPFASGKSSIHVHTPTSTASATAQAICLERVRENLSGQICFRLNPTACSPNFAVRRRMQVMLFHKPTAVHRPACGSLRKCTMIHADVPAWWLRGVSCFSCVVGLQQPDHEEWVSHRPNTVRARIGGLQERRAANRDHQDENTNDESHDLEYVREPRWLTGLPLFPQTVAGH